MGSNMDNPVKRTLDEVVALGIPRPVACVILSSVRSLYHSHQLQYRQAVAMEDELVRQASNASACGDLTS
jgi:hypothetical protein